MGSSTLTIALNSIGPEWAIAWATIALVLVTAVLMYAQLRSSKKQLQIEFLLKNRDRYDDFVMQSKRTKVAHELIRQKPQRENIPEDVANFFEDLGMQLRYRYLKPRMVWGVFGYDIVLWWFAHQAYVNHERKKRGDDKTLFSDFESLAKTMLKLTSKETSLKNSPPSERDIDEFLQEQKELIP